MEREPPKERRVRYLGKSLTFTLEKEVPSTEVKHVSIRGTLNASFIHQDEFSLTYEVDDEIAIHAESKRSSKKRRGGVRDYEFTPSPSPKERYGIIKKIYLYSHNSPDRNLLEYLLDVEFDGMVRVFMPLECIKYKVRV